MKYHPSETQKSLHFDEPIASYRRVLRAPLRCTTRPLCCNDSVSLLRLTDGHFGFSIKKKNTNENIKGRNRGGKITWKTYMVILLDWLVKIWILPRRSSWRSFVVENGVSSNCCGPQTMLSSANRFHPDLGGCAQESFPKRRVLFVFLVQKTILEHWNYCPKTVRFFFKGLFHFVFLCVFFGYKKHGQLANELSPKVVTLKGMASPSLTRKKKEHLEVLAGTKYGPHHQSRAPRPADSKSLSPNLCCHGTCE